MSSDLEHVLQDADKAPAFLYLLWGEEYLVRRGADELLKRLVPDASAGLNLFTLDGASPREVANELATMPLLPGRKVVLCRDPEFLAPKKGRTDALGKAKDAWRSGKRKEGARRVLAIAARAGWGVEALTFKGRGNPGVDGWREELSIELADQDILFLKEVAVFCKEERITAPEGDVGPLVEVLTGKLPKGHILVLAATEVDSRNALVKLARESGQLVERKVADKLKDLDLGEISREVLKPYKKRLSSAAEALLKDRVGGNMRLLQSELEKLALYAETPTIEAADVELLVGRARDEEFFELSEALQKRDLAAGLRYVQDAMGQGSHGLQLLGAVASVTRGLLEASERLARIGGRGPFRMTYNQFKSDLFPDMEAEAKAAKVKVPHPYAAYLSLQAASRYTRQELLVALLACAETDLALKSSADGRLVIERLLWKMCAKTAA